MVREPISDSSYHDVRGGRDQHVYIFTLYPTTSIYPNFPQTPLKQTILPPNHVSHNQRPYFKMSVMTISIRPDLQHLIKKYPVVIVGWEIGASPGEAMKKELGK